MIGSYSLHKEIHVLLEREAGMVELLTKTLDMPVGVVAPFRKDHPLIQKLGPELLERSSMDDTFSMLVRSTSRYLPYGELMLLRSMEVPSKKSSPASQAEPTMIPSRWATSSLLGMMGTRLKYFRLEAEMS